MESSADVLCFICNNLISQEEIQDHIYKCKLKYEGAKKIRIAIPEEYYLLFKTIKGGLSLSEEDVQNFNNLLSTKTVKKQSQKIDTNNPLSISQSLKGVSPKTQAKSPPPKRMPGQRPRGLICPLCGREYGTASLDIHIKSCRVKFEREQMDLPKNMRRSADKIIASFNQRSALMKNSKGVYDIDAINDGAFETYNKEALVPCEGCGRTFLPDRLIVHQRSCLKHKK